MDSTQQAQLNYLFIGMFDSPAGGFEPIVDDLLSLGMTMSDIADVLTNTAAYQQIYPSDEGFGAALVENVMGDAAAAADKDALAGVVDTLVADGMSQGEVILALGNLLDSPALLDDPAWGAAAQQFQNQVEVALYYSDQGGNSTDLTELNAVIDGVTDDAATVDAAKGAITPAPTPGESYVLTDGRDNLTGTDDADTFYGDVGQNQAGAVANAFASGDVIDGGADRDTVVATMINDNETGEAPNDVQAPLPRTNNVEEIRLQAMEGVVLDADHITGEDHYASVDSRGDLYVTNVDITESQITKDITLEMKDTQQGSDFLVYFNEKDLKAAPDVTVQDAEFFIQVADGNAQDPEQPIANIEFDLEFTQDGNTVVFENLESTDGTYAGLVAALQQAFAGRGLNDYTIELGTEFTDFTTNNGQTFDLEYTGFFVNVMDDGGEPFTDIEFTPRQKSGTELAIILAQSDIRSETDTITNRVEADIILDGVGRGSDGGDVMVGSTSDSDSSTGIEVFNVTVEEDSVVHNISTTNEDNTSWAGFQELNLTNGTVKGDFVLTNAMYDYLDGQYITETEDEDSGLYRNVDNADFKEGLDEINATDFEGDIVLGRDNDIVDLEALNAAVDGNVTYNATLNTGATHRATTGAGDDTYDITLNSDSGITISTGNGTNSVLLTEGESGAATADVTGGTGVETIMANNVSLTADTAGGNDVIYAENTGEKATLIVDTSGLTDATPASDGTANAAIDSGVEFLYNARLQVTIDTAGNSAAAGTNGFESELVTIEPEEGYLTSRADVNNAIMEAINENDVLNKIAVASVDAAGNVVVNYLVDGVQDTAGVKVDFFEPESTLSSSLQQNIEAEFEETYNDSGFFDDADTTAADEQNTILTGGLSAGYTSAATGTSVIPGQPAIYTIDLATAATEGAGDTLTLDTGAGPVVVYTSSSAESDGQLATSLVTQGTVTVDSVTYDVTAGTAGTEVVLTAQSNVNESDNIGVALVADGTGTVTQPGTASFAPTQDGIADSTVATGVGTDSVNTDNANEVNGGAGDDVIVLSSDDDGTAVDTVVYTGYNQGEDTIVHFETGNDQLDLSAYLTNTLSVSESDDSQVEIANTVTTGGVADLQANSVSIIGFNADTDLDDDANAVEWGELTASAFETFLEQDDSGFGTAETTDLYQDNGVSIVMVQNDEQNAQNLGEYKIFEVSYDNADVADDATDKDFTVKLIGTADVGDNASIAEGDIVA